MADLVERYRIVGENAVGAAFNQILRQSKSTADRMSGFFKTAFAGVSLLTLGRVFTATVEVNEQLAQGAIKSGIQAKAYTELAYAARQLEIDQTELATGIKKMQVALSQAASGGKAQLQVLAALNLTIGDLKKLKPDEQFEAIAEQISRIKDPADRTRAAVELFGRSGADLLPLFEQGAAGIRKARLEAQAFGKSLSEKDLEAFRKADDALDRLKESAGSLANTLVLNLSPTLIRAIDSMRSLFGGTLDSEHLVEEMRDAERAVASFGNMILESPEGIKALERYNKLLQQSADLEARRRAAIQGQPGMAPRGRGPGDAPPGFETADGEMQKARRELLALGDPVQKLTAQFEAQKAKIDELVKTYPDLAGVAGGVIRQLTIEYTDSVEQATEELRRFQRQADSMRHEAADLAAPLGFLEMEDNTRAINEEMAKIKEKTLELPKAFEEADDSAKDLMTTLKDEAARRAFGAISDVLYNMNGNAKDFARNMLDAFRRILADKATQQLFELLSGLGSGGSSGGGFWGALAGGIGSLFGGGGLRLPGGSTPTVPSGGSGGFRGLFAHGGTLMPGEWGIAGEKGPELAFGGAHGQTIVPLGRAGRESAAPWVTNISINPVYNTDARGATSDLVKALPGLFQENNRRLLETLRDARSRGL